MTVGGSVSILVLLSLDSGPPIWISELLIIYLRLFNSISI